MLVSQQPGSQTWINKLFCLFPIAITSRWKPLEPLVQCYISHNPNRSQCWKQRSPVKTSSIGDHAEIRPGRPIHLQAVSRFRCADTNPPASQCCSSLQQLYRAGSSWFPSCTGRQLHTQQLNDLPGTWRPKQRFQPTSSQAWILLLLLLLASRLKIMSVIPWCRRNWQRQQTVGAFKPEFSLPSHRRMKFSYQLHDGSPEQPGPMHGFYTTPLWHHLPSLIPIHQSYSPRCLLCRDLLVAQENLGHITAFSSIFPSAPHIPLCWPQVQPSKALILGWMSCWPSWEALPPSNSKRCEVP